MNPLKYTKQLNVSYTLGATLTIELLETKPQLVKHIYVHADTERNDTYHFIEKLCALHHISMSQNNKAFNILSNKENVYFIGEFAKFSSDIDAKANHIVLVNPANAGNLGTIIRTMVGFNMLNLAIITPSVDFFDPKVVRASMGSIFHLNFAFFSSFQDYLEKFAHHPYCFMLKGKNELPHFLFKTPYALVFGNEATGLSDQFLDIGESIKINHSSLIDSLNLPMAVGIALYETTKNNF
ncbi:MAG: TrmH family RNA methyltransferase [Bacilli bacterium]